MNNIIGKFEINHEQWKLKFHVSKDCLYINEWYNYTFLSELNCKIVNDHDVDWSSLKMTDYAVGAVNVYPILLGRGPLRILDERYGKLIQKKVKQIMNLRNFQ